jgi:hypothetical protein
MKTKMARRVGRWRKPVLGFIWPVGTGAPRISAGHSQVRPERALENCSITCQIKNGPSSRAMAEASFDFQMANRQIRRIATPTCENHNQFRVASSRPPRIALWYLLGHLGVFNRQQVSRLRSHCPYHPLPHSQPPLPHHYNPQGPAACLEQL